MSKTKNSFRRGFKTEAKELALDLRNELGLSLSDRLDPFRLANHLLIPVLPLTVFREVASSAVQLLSSEAAFEFSAVTVFSGIRRAIVHNDSHAIVRQNSNIAHELAHAILQHPPCNQITCEGRIEWNPVEENEANWLAGELLVPSEAAFQVAMRRTSVLAAAERYGVSNKMMEFRLNASGARKRAQRFM